jgi:hypothetical protein
MDEPAALVVLPRLQVQHANAISGSICWGFPSPTAFPLNCGKALAELESSAISFTRRFASRRSCGPTFSASRATQWERTAEPLLWSRRAAHTWKSVW